MLSTSLPPYIPSKPMPPRFGVTRRVTPQPRKTPFRHKAVLLPLLALIGIAAPFGGQQALQNITQAYERQSETASLLSPAAYNHKLNELNFDLTQDQLIQLGKQEYQRIETEMLALAKTIDPKRSWQQIMEEYCNTHHPKAMSDVLPAYREEMQRVKAFIKDHDLVSLPSSDPPLGITPDDLKERYPFAAYLWQGKESQIVVTLKMNDKQSDEEALRTHSDGHITPAIIHEGYPGHHVQFAAHPGKQHSETFSEGWALYAEELMIRSGYYDTMAPEKKLIALRTLLWRAARAYIDPMIHAGKMSPEAAVDFLSHNLGISPDRAKAEVHDRYIGRPGSAATYLVGKLQIEQLRRQVEAEEGHLFNQRRFHDRLLSQGSLPVQVVAKQAFLTKLEPISLK